MTYDEAKCLTEAARSKSRTLCAALRALPEDTSEFAAARKAFGVALARERCINNWFLNTFRSEIRADAAKGV